MIVLIILGILLLFGLLIWVGFITRNPFTIDNINNYDSRVFNCMINALTTVVLVGLGILTGMINLPTISLILYIGAVFLTIPKYTFLPLEAFVKTVCGKIADYTIKLDKRIHKDGDES